MLENFSTTLVDCQILFGLDADGAACSLGLEAVFDPTKQDGKLTRGNGNASVRLKRELLHGAK